MTRVSIAVLCLVAISCGTDGSRNASSRGELTGGTLPGGTSIEVGFTAPSDGALVPAGPVAITGTAQVGVAPPVPTDMVLVLDLSGSTANGGGCGGDQNGDGSQNTVLDCEIAALRAVNAQLVSAGSVQHLGVVVFGTNAVTADMQPIGGDQAFTEPNADLNTNGTRDVDEVLTSAVQTARITRFIPKTLTGPATSYGAALTSLANIFHTSTATRKVAVMVSDGLPNAAPTVASTISMLPPGTIVSTIAAGSLASCGSGVESLQYIATHTGGSCINVANLSMLPDLAPALVKSTLAAVELTVDGAPQALDSIAPTLPQDGPVSVTWTSSATGLAPGPHTLCATATGTDIGGALGVSECVTIVINSPPNAVCGPVTVPADGTCQGAGSINQGSSDPDGNLVGCVEAPPGPFSLGATSVTLTCTDSLGQAASCSTPVTVVDATPPTFTTLPAPICTHRKCVHLGTPVAIDNCGPVTLTHNAPSQLPCGVTVVTRTATDGAGNATTATQQVTRICHRCHHEGHHSHAHDHCEMGVEQERRLDDRCQGQGGHDDDHDDDHCEADHDDDHCDGHGDDDDHDGDDDHGDHH